MAVAKIKPHPVRWGFFLVYQFGTSKIESFAIMVNQMYCTTMKSNGRDLPLQNVSQLTLGGAMRSAWRYLCLFLLVFSALFAYGQNGGQHNFTASDSFGSDSVDLTTLVPTIDIPMISKGAGQSLSIISPQSCQATGPVGHFGTSCGGFNNLAGFDFTPQEMMGMSTNATFGGSPCFIATVTKLIGADGLTSYQVPRTQFSVACGTYGSTHTVTSTDGSGITATIHYPSNNVPPDVTSAHDASGAVYTEVTQHHSWTVADSFGNTISYSQPATGNGSFTDKLGAVTTISNSSTAIPYQYTDTSGNTQTISTTNGTSGTFSGLCGSSNSASETPIASINFPDGTSIGFTWDTISGNYDGLIKSFTLRTGGTISYTYGSLALACSQAFAFNTLNRVTADGTTQYSLSINTSNSTTTTTKLDPGMNKTVWMFFGTPAGPTQSGYGMFLNTVTRYQNTGTVASPSYTQISSTTYCYNNASCSTAPTYPITQRDIYEYVGTGSTQMSHRVETFDSTYGLLLTDTNTDSVTGQSVVKTIVYGTWNGSACAALGNTNVVDHSCTITSKNGSTQLSYQTFTYNSNGAPTASTNWVNSTDTLTTSYTPNANGTIASVTTPNNQVINNTYGNCNSLLLTDTTTTVNSVVLDNKKTWDCNGGVVLDTTDENGNEDDTTYDAMFRPATHVDKMEQTTTYAYTSTSAKVTDPMGVDRLRYVDGYGRTAISQTRQSSGSSNYDTISSTYGWKDSGNNSLTNFQKTVSVPCVTTLGATCSTVAITSLSNPIAGPISSTDAIGGTTTWGVGFSSSGQDVSVTAGPAPSGENTKKVQNEHDGFGRIKSTCAVETSGGTACGQALGNSGILTSNTYSFDATTGAPKVVTTRGSQTHTTIGDPLGRVTSVQTPEAGTVTNTYDTETSCGANGSYSSQGNLVKAVDAAGNQKCFYYDGLSRLTYLFNNINNSTNPCRILNYDATSNGWTTPPTGYPTTGANIIGRLMEGTTTDCNGGKLTDEWFAYDKDGRITDMWEWTSLGQAYYHTAVAYDADGTVTSLSGVPGLSTLTYVTDGEDRWNTATVGTSTIVSGVTYDAASRPTRINIGTGTDNDQYAYDNVGNVTQEQYTVGSSTRTDVLTWSPNSSLRTLAVTDGFNSSNTQTCNFGTSSVMGYDDVGRLLSDNCGTPWSQSFTYDDYDNLKQSGSASYQPNYSSTNNQDSFDTYDSNGNVTKDAAGNTYTYNVYGQMVTFNGGSTILYDAFGREVANPYTSTNEPTQTETLYSPMGMVGLVVSGGLGNTVLPLPGGGKLNTASYYNHMNWLGSAVVESSVSTGLATDRSFAPYGQTYQELNHDNPIIFAGTTSFIQPYILHDTPNRELEFASARWHTPDPAHASWNAYSYVTDPNSETDPSGLGPDDWQNQAPNIAPGWCATFQNGDVKCNASKKEKEWETKSAGVSLIAITDLIKKHALTKNMKFGEQQEMMKRSFELGQDLEFTLERAFGRAYNQMISYYEKRYGIREGAIRVYRSFSVDAGEWGEGSGDPLVQNFMKIRTYWKWVNVNKMWTPEQFKTATGVDVETLVVDAEAFAKIDTLFEKAATGGGAELGAIPAALSIDYSEGRITDGKDHIGVNRSGWDNIVNNLSIVWQHIEATAQSGNVPIN